MNSLYDQVDFYFRDNDPNSTWVCINDDFLIAIPVDGGREEIMEWLEITIGDTSYEIMELGNTWERILFREESGLVLFKMRWL